MLQRYKYSINGVYRCENFSQHLENDDFTSTQIGQASHILWYIQFQKRVRDGSTVAYPIIYHLGKPKTLVRAYFTYLKKDGSSCWKHEYRHIYLESNEACIGKYVDIVELLDENNGYLDNGAITIEYGLQVDSKEVEDGIWAFNIFERFFDWQTKNSVFKFIALHGSFFCHKQIVKLHSKKLSDIKEGWIITPNLFPFDEFFLCLQIAHGVRFPRSAYKLEETIGMAFDLGFSNTMRYCEQKLIEMDEQPKPKMRHFEMARKFNMERYLKHFMIYISSAKRLMSILKRMNIEKMSSESMKAFVAKFFDLIDLQE